MGARRSLTSLKYQDGRFENASVEFDEAALAPTYRLMWGIPGRSNALNIAARLGLDPGIVAAARARLGTAQVLFCVLLPFLCMSPVRPCGLKPLDSDMQSSGLGVQWLSGRSAALFSCVLRASMSPLRSARCRHAQPGRPCAPMQAARKHSLRGWAPFSSRQPTGSAMLWEGRQVKGGVRHAGAGVQGRVDDAIAELEQLRRAAEADEQRAADLRRDADRLSALLRQTRRVLVDEKRCMLGVGIFCACWSAFVRILTST